MRLSTLLPSVLLLPPPPSAAWAFAGLPPVPPSRRETAPTALSSASSSSTSCSPPGAATTVATEPIAGMRPGTSGLRKKVEVWMSEDGDDRYLENFLQSVVDAAAESDPLRTVLVAGDGRHGTPRAIAAAIRVLSGNGVARIAVPRGGVMSTPAVSAAVRRWEGGAAQGAIVLTASHNPGGPGKDFGVKYNSDAGQPADEAFTELVYQKSLEIKSFQTVEPAPEIDLSAPAGTEFRVTPSSTVVLIDPFESGYLDALKECFDFAALKEFVRSEPRFSVLYDGMHGAGGPFARRVLVDELGLPPSSLLRCDPRPDFGGAHPDPNLAHASALIEAAGLAPDGWTALPSDGRARPTLAAANDGDGDRHLVAGDGAFVTPSDGLAIVSDRWEAIPWFRSRGGLKGVARSMPSSAALDAVAEASGVPCFVTPTGWKFFGNLMDSKERFGKTDYTPFLCGEESFGIGSDHVREKDGLWAVLAWMSILMEANKGNADGKLVGVKDILTQHWAKYGRHYYCRYDYEGVDSEDANKVMDYIRDQFVEGDCSALPPHDSGYTLVKGEEFSYTDPVDGSVSSNQGLILSYVRTSPSGQTQPARAVFRLSGTGSSGATIRMYLERFEADPERHGSAASDALRSLAEAAASAVRLEELTGRDSPTVVT